MWKHHSPNTRASCWNLSSLSIIWFSGRLLLLHPPCAAVHSLTWSNSSRSTSPSPFRSNILKAISKFLWGAGHKHKFRNQYNAIWEPRITLNRARQQLKRFVWIRVHINLYVNTPQRCNMERLKFFKPRGCTMSATQSLPHTPPSQSQLEQMQHSVLSTIKLTFLWKKEPKNQVRNSENCSQWGPQICAQPIQSLQTGTTLQQEAAHQIR